MTTTAGSSGNTTTLLATAADTYVAIGTQLLIDGSFETSGVGANTWIHTPTVGGWQSSTEIETWGKGFYGLTASNGNNFAEQDYDTRLSNIFQNVKTEAGASYSFSFDFMKRPDSVLGSDTIKVYWNGNWVGTVDPTVSVWHGATFSVIGTGGIDKIEFIERSEERRVGKSVD